MTKSTMARRFAFPAGRRLLPLVLVVMAIGADAADFSLRLIGQQTIATGTLVGDVEFGGISGVDRASDGSFWAISDDRGGERGAPRFYRLIMTYDSSGFHGITISQQIRMQQPDGSDFTATSRTVDPEGIRVAPNGNLYWSSEGIWHSDPARHYQPFVREMDANGRFVREFVTPPLYHYADGAATGGRDNKLFEALAVSPKGLIFVANEDALIQDGNISSPNAGSFIRVTALDPISGNPVAQYAYRLPPIPMAGVAGPGRADNGLSELLAISETRFIAVERAYVPGAGNIIRLVLSGIEVDTTDVADIPSLASSDFNPMSREQLLEMPLEYQGIKLDNIEAISWGDALPNGNRTLVLVSDNNFSTSQVSQFIAFELVPAAQTSGR